MLPIVDVFVACPLAHVDIFIAFRRISMTMILDNRKGPNHVSILDILVDDRMAMNSGLDIFSSFGYPSLLEGTYP